MNFKHKELKHQKYDKMIEEVIKIRKQNLKSSDNSTIGSIIKKYLIQAADLHTENQQTQNQPKANNQSQKTRQRDSA